MKLSYESGSHDHHSDRSTEMKMLNVFWSIDSFKERYPDDKVDNQRFYFFYCHNIQNEYKFHIPFDTHTYTYSQKRVYWIPINLTEWCWSLDYGNYWAREMLFYFFPIYKLSTAINKYSSRSINCSFVVVKLYINKNIESIVER